MNYIIDTNIWIYLFEGIKEVEEIKKRISQKEIIPILTPVVYTEVLGWQEIGEEAEKAIRNYFSSLEMLDLSMEHWEQIISWRKSGIKKRLPDLMIASVSEKSGFPVLTRNIKDYDQLGIEIEDPWKRD